MRSAETSGVDGNGLRPEQRQTGLITSLFDTISKSARRLITQASPITIAVTITALAAATLFVIADSARTLSDIRLRDEIRAVVMNVEGIDLERVHQGFAEVGTEAPILGVLQRGAIAFGTALLLIGLTFRRRGIGALPSTADVRRYEELLATIPFGVACWSEDGTLVVCNPQYRARLHVEGPETRPGASYNASVKRLIQGGYMQLVSEDDSSRLLELHREDGSILLIDERPLNQGGFVTLVTDITERRRTDHLLSSIREEQRLLARRYHEEKLRAEAASRSKTSFLAHLSHDIRTPLNHIIGFAEMMRQQTYGPLGDQRYLGYVEAVKGSGERLLNFFSSILELAELESGQKALRQQSLDVDDMLVAVTRRYSSQAQRAGLTLGLAGPCDAALLGDRFALERMLGNIVENSIRFTQAGGKVTIAAYAADDGVVIEITDTGIGMSEERLENLSQPFVFGDAAFTKEHNGAGLGIAIARAIAQLSGGHLAIDSRQGLGTTVAISLPLLANEERNRAA
jgi:two-component system cell cycle sensor histidine kinase PleC